MSSTAGGRRCSRTQTWLSLAFISTRVPRQALKRAGSWMSSFLSDWSTTTARSASSSAALAGCLQSWRSKSTLRYESFWEKHRTGSILRSDLWTEGAFSSKTRYPGPRRSALPRERSAGGILRWSSSCRISGQTKLQNLLVQSLPLHVPKSEMG